MPETLHGFPFWVVEFDDRGQLRDAAAAATLVNDAASLGLTDLFVFSHGWNNGPDEARRLYDGFFGAMSTVLADATTKARDATIGFAGIMWPSILWPDASSAAGGAASLGAGDLAAALKTVFAAPAQQALIDDLVALLATRAPSDAALREFKTKLGALMTEGGDPRDVDALESAAATLPDDQYAEVFEALADTETTTDADAGGAAAFPNPFAKLWDGAKEALRMTTYWQMKNRAGTVGRSGLAPLLMQLHRRVPTLAIHLLGHSFGARLVSYSLAGLPATATGAASPVKSLFLLQGAFSHFAFADALPFDRARHGDLQGMAARVDGPLLTTHTLKDGAVGMAYPLASMIAGEDASDASDRAYRWGAMGHDGAQAVNAASSTLGAPGTSYLLPKGQWLNLDANAVIVNGPPPIGAHGDIVHPHTAWAALAGAGVVGGR